MGKDPSGNAKGINTDSKGNLRVVQSLNKQIMIADRIPEGVPGYIAEEGIGVYPTEFWEYSGYTVIDELEWQTDKETKLWLRIMVKVGDEWKETNYTINADFSLLRIQDPLEISKGAALWEILAYDNISTNKLFKFRLKNPIIAPEGIRIYFDNRNATMAKAGIVLRGRTIA